MVFAFLIHTLSGFQLRILYSQVYGCESFCQSNTEIRSARKKTLMKIAARVQSEFFAHNNPVYRSHSQEISDEFQHDEQVEANLFLLSSKVDANPFSSSKVVLWQSIGNLAFALVLESTENRILAFKNLKSVIKYLQEQTQVLNNPKEILLKADQVTTVLSQYFPNGQLLFMNHRVLRQAEKEMQSKK